MSIQRAIVLGGSVTGLLAAAALSDVVKSVVIVDRDELVGDGPDALKSRRGVPQGDQVHHLLALGADRIEQLLPGLSEELLAEGCSQHDNLAEFAQFTYGAWRARFESDLKLTCFTRPVFEGVIRRRVLKIANVTTHKGVVSGLVASDDKSAIIGAKVKNASDGVLLGDLVVDATGRGTKTPRWIEDLGYPRPAEWHLRVYMGYSCFLIEIPEGELPEGVSALACAPTADNKSNGMAVWPCGRGQHIVVAAGTMRNYPPASVEGVLEIADNLPTPLIANAIRSAKVVSEPKTYQMSGDQRIRWEDMDRRPEGLVVLGDAVASYNPTYGQGMTMAAVGSVELRSILRETNGDITGVADRLQKQLSPMVDLAWDNAVKTDSVYEGVEYENMEPPAKTPPEFAKAFVEVQSAEPEVALAARKAMLWMDNGYLTTPSVQKKIADWIADGRTVGAAAGDPLAIPPLIGA
ncbi:hypothetical protein R4P64_31190 [Rhodococcus sp. IEGM 1366]|uniref:FAD-dependent oxidoreductase n=1 Tax=Rhodococcus sp. IEGM 1366 TaxID=3082223 RepID=UPI002953D29C|nr:hypothetical protein [Rhodococcus sp. IEGM 1366]MDV8070990.1 hypothetical protein [Rhodococcus sp. IEGM 1366]